MGRALVALAAIALVPGVVESTPAAGARHDSRTHAKRGPNSFDGSCKLSGELAFDTPLGADVRTTTFTDRGTGTCTGKLNGAPVHEIPVVNRVTGTATASCAAGVAH